MGRGMKWGLAAVGLPAVLWFARAGAACELPPPPDPAQVRAVYRVIPGPSRVRFDAKAFLHDFAGTTSRIEGTIRTGELDRLSNAEACVQIDASSLDTGNATRDGIMRADHLETEKFPSIVLLLNAVDGVKHQAGTWEFTARGTLSLHGVSRDIQLPVRAGQEGDTVHLTGQVPLRMTDYRIRIPRFLVFTVEDQVMVSFDLTARRAR